MDEYEELEDCLYDPKNPPAHPPVNNTIYCNVKKTLSNLLQKGEISRDEYLKGLEHLQSGRDLQLHNDFLDKIRDRLNEQD